MADLFWDAVTDLIIVALESIESDVKFTPVRRPYGIMIEHSPIVPYEPIAWVKFQFGHIYVFNNGNAVAGHTLIVDPAELGFQFIVKRHIAHLL